MSFRSRNAKKGNLNSGQYTWMANDAPIKMQKRNFNLMYEHLYNGKHAHGYVLQMVSHIMTAFSGDVVMIQ